MIQIEYCYFKFALDQHNSNAALNKRTTDTKVNTFLLVYPRKAQKELLASMEIACAYYMALIAP